MTSRKTPPYWISGGTETCESCTGAYVLQAEFRCVACDGGFCEQCVIVLWATREVFCEACAPEAGQG